MFLSLEKNAGRNYNLKIDNKFFKKYGKVQIFGNNIKIKQSLHA
jgi:hypothetical protein